MKIEWCRAWKRFVFLMYASEALTLVLIVVAAATKHILWFIVALFPMVATAYYHMAALAVDLIYGCSGGTGNGCVGRERGNIRSRC